MTTDNNLKEKIVTVTTPYSDTEIKEYTERVIKTDTEIMKEQNGHLQAFLSKVGHLKVDFFPYSLEEELMDLGLIDDIQLLLDLHKEIHRYIHYLTGIITYGGDYKYIDHDTLGRVLEALNRNHFRVSMRIRELRRGMKHKRTWSLMSNKAKAKPIFF